MTLKVDPTKPPTAIIPHLIARDAAAAIEFYTRAFGAEELVILREPSGKVAHAEMALGQGRFMLADEYPESDCLGPLARGGTAISLMYYVQDVDEFAANAVSHGATLERPIKTEFYGDRVAWLRDPFGHRWSFATRVEAVGFAEMCDRFSQLG